MANPIVMKCIFLYLQDCSWVKA